MRRNLFVLAALLTSLPHTAWSDTHGPGKSAPPDNMIVAGWIEDGWVGQPPVKFRVKLDTGAKTSSINAPGYREFTKVGKRYVAFTLANKDGRELTVEQPVLRVATIRRAGVAKRTRPVIRLKLCVAGVTSEVEFSLADPLGAHISHPDRARLSRRKNLG